MGIMNLKLYFSWQLISTVSYTFCLITSQIILYFYIFMQTTNLKLEMHCSEKLLIQYQIKQFSHI